MIQQTQANTYYLLVICTILGLSFLATLASGGALLALGITPRKSYGLLGILFAPLLHANFNHLFFNLIPLLILSNFLLLNGIGYFIVVSIFITLISGILTWCFGRRALHIGASGLVTGYWSLLVCNIYQQGTLVAIITGGLSLYYFAGIFLGIFPLQKGVSWEGHLFGFIAGILVAGLLKL